MRLGGVELGGTKVRCAIGAADGTIESEVRIPTTEPSATLSAVLDFFRSGSMPDAIGVGCFGPIDLTQGRIRQTPKPGWSGFDVRGALEVLGVSVVIDTDVAAALAGERRWGAAQAVSRAVYVTVGTGIGGAAEVGAPCHAEMGHIPIPRAPEDVLDRGICPFHPDCWEGWASGPAMAARWSDPVALPIEDPAWKLEAYYLAQGFRAIALSLAPERIIVGGGVGLRAGLLPLVHEALDAAMNDYGGYGPSSQWVVPAGLAEDAGLLGAIALVS